MSHAPLLTKTYRNFIVPALSSAVCLSLSWNAAPPNAFAHPSNAATTVYTVGAESTHSLSPEDAQFIDHVAAAGETFVEIDGKIATTATDGDLSDTFGFTERDLKLLHESVLGKPVRVESAPVVKPYAYREGAAVCFTRNDLLVGAGAAIVAAADAGPVALAAALEAAATVFGGPIGAGIGAVLAVASAPSLIEIGGRAVSAVATGRGLKIGVQADYPPVYADYC